MEITAENMRKLSSPYEEELSDILKKIEERAKGGYVELFLNDYNISQEDRLELTKRGFKVELGGRFNEVDTYISWKL